MRLATRLTLLGIATGFAGLLPLHGECPLQLRSYEDVDGNGLILELDPLLEKLSDVEVTTTRPLHSDRGEIARFRVVRDDRDRIAFLADLGSLVQESGAPLDDLLWQLPVCKE